MILLLVQVSMRQTRQWSPYGDGVDADRLIVAGDIIDDHGDLAVIVVISVADGKHEPHSAVTSRVERQSKRLVLARREVAVIESGVVNVETICPACTADGEVIHQC